MGLFKKPKAGAPSAEDQALERRRRKEIDELTEKENQTLKAGMRGAGGRRALLSGNFISGGILSAFRGSSRPSGNVRQPRLSGGGVLSGAGPRGRSGIAP